jgi:lipopolysaccharide export system permease protein
MQILTRYLIRAHAGPFVFAVTALTGLLFLNAVAQRLENLAGKGLPLEVILEFLSLSLPHTVALTLPMAVLVSVLYAFSELTANNEITAMKAGGIRPQRILLPLLGVGVIVAGIMFYFNDQVLPEANHRLKNLLVDINRKSPTFTLREQVVNEVRMGLTGDVYWLTAARIDDTRAELHDIAIFDGSSPVSHRTTYADRGVMAFNESRTDLFLTLFDGKTYETADEPGGFQLRYFDRQILPLREIGNEMQRRAGGSDRSDREMTIAMLDSASSARDWEVARVGEENRARSIAAVRLALGLPLDDASAEEGEDVTLKAAAMSQGIRGRDMSTATTAVFARMQEGRADALRQSANRYRVEIHKKYTLAFACIVFVLLGAPLAVRFPRGGLGLVIAASSAIFAIYWMGLIGGESLADRGVAPPAVTMWTPNVLFTLLGLWLFQRMGREAATTRGGGWEDLYYTVRSGLARPLRKLGVSKPLTRPGS